MIVDITKFTFKISIVEKIEKIVEVFLGRKKYSGLYYQNENRLNFVNGLKWEKRVLVMKGWSINMHLCLY